MDTATSVTIDDVRAAAARLDGIAHRTPVLTSRILDERAGAEVFVKCENLQRVGAFKFRGAYNAIALLSPEQRARGVAAYSSGNHAQAVALAARELGTSAVILMPEDAPRSKRAATAGYGAEVVTYDRYTEDRTALARALADERGLALIPPYDHPDVIAGQGTAALELLAETGGLDALLVPVGGGAGCWPAPRSPPLQRTRPSGSSASSRRAATTPSARWRPGSASPSPCPGRSPTGRRCPRRAS
ncbi:hypothetical protein GCM10020001_002450 [Nonomuraea salmonea]